MKATDRLHPTDLGKFGCLSTHLLCLRFSCYPRDLGLKLSLADLLNPVASEAGYNRLKKKISALKEDEQQQTLAEPLPEIRQEEITRKVAYSETKEELQKWQNIVKQHREAG